jgi:hypothetical protein
MNPEYEPLDRQDRSYKSAKTAFNAGTVTDRDRELIDVAAKRWGPQWMLTPNERKFRQYAAELAEFRSINGRLPTKYAVVEPEAALGKWLSALVSRKTRLSAVQIALLDDLVPGWNTRLDDAWNAKAQQLARFVAEERRLPRHRMAEAEERSLDNWLNMQSRAEAGKGNSAGTFTSERRDRLNAIHEGWRRDRSLADEMLAAKWRRNAEALGRYNVETGGWPSAHAGSAEVRKLAQWMNTQRGYSADFGSPDELDRVATGWRGPDKHLEWAAKAAAAGAFYATNGRLPGLVSGDAGDERRLSRWLATQRSASTGGAGAGAWTKRRARELDELVPGWALPPVRMRRKS